MIIKVCAVFILVSFYGTYFLKMILQKRQGISTNQLGKGKKGLEKVIESIMQILTILVTIMDVWSIFFSSKQLPNLIQYIGVIIAFVGTLFFIISVKTMKNNWRAGVPKTDKTELVTEGIYKISRNPAFLGFDLLFLGFVFMFFNWILLVISLFTIVLIHFQITKVEEPFLRETFGKSYEEYTNKVLRYLGRNFLI